MKNKTVICHFYNEEYLLPWWLKHHKNIFNDGIMINYRSTDKSVDIIKEICPTWKIVDTKNEFFGAIEIDREIEQYEKNIEGPRIVLNVTEFLIGNFSKLESMPCVDLLIHMASMNDSDANMDSYPDPSVPLTEQRQRGVYPNIYEPPCRYFHENKNIYYPIGRHYLESNTDDFIILRYKHSPWNEKFIKRKMQIGDKRSPSDINHGLGAHHSYSLNQLLEDKKRSSLSARDLSTIIQSFEYWKY